MSLRKIFWIVLVITLMVWTGVGVYFWTLRTQKETRVIPPRVMPPETRTVSPPTVSLPSWAQIKPQSMITTGRVKNKDINKNTITIKEPQTEKEATITIWEHAEVYEAQTIGPHYTNDLSNDSSFLKTATRSSMAQIPVGGLATILLEAQRDGSFVGTKIVTVNALIIK